mmetsp:Transcript_12838/g.27234  ORF Transcript_12838/g.27234 Transcript_12838/m.27234 type:complete len:271 (+) Transcript_12838:3194-4006(+)
MNAETGEVFECGIFLFQMYHRHIHSLGMMNRIRIQRKFRQWFVHPLQFSIMTNPTTAIVPIFPTATRSITPNLQRIPHKPLSTGTAFAPVLQHSQPILPVILGPKPRTQDMTRRHDVHFRPKGIGTKFQPVQLMGEASGSPGRFVGVVLSVEEFLAEVLILRQVGVVGVRVHVGIGWNNCGWRIVVWIVFDVVSSILCISYGGIHSAIIFRGEGIDIDQKRGGPAEDFKVFHSQGGVFEVDAESESRLGRGEVDAMVIVVGCRGRRRSRK